MRTTRTGQWEIGFRRGWSDWQRDIDGLCEWAKSAGFSFLDFGPDYPEFSAKVHAHGLSVGSVDLTDWGGLFSANSEKRAAAITKNQEIIRLSSALGAKHFFIVVLPEDATLPRSENLGFAIESLNSLAKTLAENGSDIVIEGWPGNGALACTPETVRALLGATPPEIGLNYDPSHLIRMGVDPIRFLREFANRVYHVHGKDTEIFEERIYECGTEQPAALAKSPDFGGPFWRYTIPGHGQTRWTEAFKILHEASYSGRVSIELEDANFNGTEAGEKHALTVSGQFLASV